MYKNLIYVLLVSLFFSSCSLTENNVIIDNPKFSDITVEIDGQSYSIHGYTNQAITITDGTYHMKATTDDGDVVFDNEVTIGDDGILNPTEYTYIKWTDLYLEDENMYDVYAMSALNVSEYITVNDKEYNDVDFAVYEGDVFIAESWDFGIDEHWSDDVYVSDGDNYAVRSKVYRADELEEEWGYYGDIDLSDFTEEDIDLLMDSLDLMLEDIELEE